MSYLNAYIYADNAIYVKPQLYYVIQLDLTKCIYLETGKCLNIFNIKAI